MYAIARRGMLPTLLFALALFACGIATPRAQGLDDPFTVADVPVDATAANAAAARDAARLDGQRRALRSLLERLTLAADHGRLPRVPDSRITEMVRDLAVANERSSGVRYIADYTFRFQPDDVRSLLRDGGIPFAETMSKPVVVLPVLRQGDGALLWDDPNPWRDAWANFKGASGLVPLDVPIGDAADVAAIDAQQVISGDAAALAAMAERHGGDDVLSALASQNGSGGIDTVIRRISPAAATPIATASIRANPGESEGDLMARAVAASDAALEEAWKRDNLLRFGQEGVLTADVPVASLADWIFVRDRLGGLAAITRSEVRVLGKAGAQVEIHYLGDPDRLRLALAQRDLVLNQSGAGWTLQRRNAAAPR